MKNTELLELIIDEEDESGVDYIALVDSPAIESEWMAFKKHQFEETFNDYPESASNNAKKAIEYKEENGSDCGTRIGWTRARQLANKEKISWETIARMASFKRHQQNKDVPYSEGCGGIMWDAWGGASGINWAIEKMKTKDKYKQVFKIQNEEKRIVSGYFMKADLPIIRLNEDNEKYYVVFRKETIEKIVNKFFKNGLNANVNLMHDNNLKAKGVYVIESLIIDSKRGIKAPKGFENAPDGSWWGSMRVENDEVWQMVKDGSFKGFSVEGMFGQSKSIKYPVSLINKIREVVKKYIQKKKDNFVSMVINKDFAIIDDRLAYASKDMALKAAMDLGIEGIHEHEYEGQIWYMVGETHKANMYKKCPPGYVKKNGKCVKKKTYAEIGPKGGVKKSPKAPKSKTPNKNPKGKGSAKGNAKNTRGAKVTKEDEATLQKKSDDFNERYKEKLGYGVTVGQLKTVFQRGLGAYNTSHSPSVKSAKQWALARVNAYLYLVKNGRPENPKYTTDYDLLPSKHPKSKK